MKIELNNFYNCCFRKVAFVQSQGKTLKTSKMQKMVIQKKLP